MSNDNFETASDKMAKTTNEQLQFIITYFVYLLQVICKTSKLYKVFYKLPRNSLASHMCTYLTSVSEIYVIRPGMVKAFPVPHFSSNIKCAVYKSEDYNFTSTSPQWSV